eukprot:g774.t1
MPSGHAHYMDTNKSKECQHPSENKPGLETNGGIFLIDGDPNRGLSLIDMIKCAQNSGASAVSFSPIRGMILIEHRQIIPRQEKVSFEIWMSGYCIPDVDCESQIAFFLEMADFVEELVVRNLLDFSIHYVIWKCPSGQESSIPCQSQCIYQGRYCSPQPEISPGTRVTGQDIIKETTRELCLLRLLQETGLVAIWWEYIALFLQQCNQQTGKARGLCSQKVFIQAGGDKVLNGNKRWESCIKRHKFNQQGMHFILEKEVELQLQSNVYTRGEIRINGVSYLGDVIPSSMMMAICSGLLQNKVQVCEEYTSEIGVLDPVRKMESDFVKGNSTLISNAYPVSPSNSCLANEANFQSSVRLNELRDFPIEGLVSSVACVLVLMIAAVYLGIRRLDVKEGSGCNYDATADLKIASSLLKEDSGTESSSNIPFRHCHLHSYYVVANGRSLTVKRYSLKQMTPLRNLVALSLDPRIHRPIHGLTEDRVLLHAGNSVVILNTNTRERETFQLDDRFGIGCIAVHSTGDVIAIGETSPTTDPPNVRIFKLTTDCAFELLTILKNGAKRKYDAMDFTSDGEMLATVSGAPDYFLTLWNWKTGDVVLRSKAFSQDIYTVKCSRFFEDQLITSGVGHIKFWKKANTFTGMKLQGILGKFGKHELVDIPDFIELSNGDVLSATESGNLLLWQDGFIKAVLHCPGDEPFHNGSINYTAFDIVMQRIITAACDGVIKVWNPEHILTHDAEISGEVLELNPVAIIDLNRVSGEFSNRYKIKQLVQSHGTWTVFLESGGVVQLCINESAEDYTPVSMRCLWDYGSGGISALAAFHNKDCFAVAEGSGVISLYNTQTRNVVYRSKAFSSATTCLALTPKLVDLESQICVAGFEDGTIRVLVRCLDNWKLLYVYKPHKIAVALLLFSPDGGVLASISFAGQIFFFKYQELLEPIGFCELAENVDTRETQICVTCGCFGEADAKLYIGTEDGSLFKVDIPKYSQTNSAPENYRVDTLIEQIKLPIEKSTEEGQMDEELSQSVLSILSLLQDSKQKLLVTFGGLLSGKVYCISVEDTLMEHLVTLNDSSSITHMLVMDYNGSVLAGTSNGCIYSWNLESLEDRVKGFVRVHDHDRGSIRGLGTSTSKQTIISAGQDGTLFLMENPWPIETVAELVEAENLPMVEEDENQEVDDITDPNAPTIDEAKQREAELCAEVKAQDKKRRVGNYIEDLRVQFCAIKAENDARPINKRLDSVLFQIDENLKERIEAEIKKNIEESKRKFAFALEKELIGVVKLRERYFDNIEEHSESLTGLSQNQQLVSFCIQSIDPKLLLNLTSHRDQVHNEPDINREVGINPKHSADNHKNNVSQMNQEGDLEPSSRHNFAGRSQQRKKRQERMQHHEATKSSLSNESVQDLTAIEVARNTLGDLKFKLDPDFSPLMAANETPEMKRTEIAKITVGIYQLQKGFNLAFRDLKEKKKKLISKIVDQAQIFKANSKTTFNELTLPRSEPYKDTPTVNKQSQNELLLQYKANKIRKQEKRTIEEFNEEFQSLCLRKLDLQCDLKYLEMLRLVKEDELTVLESFQEEEIELNQKLAAKLKEMNDLKEHISAIEAQSKQREAEDNSGNRKRELLREFDALVMSVHPHRSYLLRILHQQNSSNCEENGDFSSDESELSEEGTEECPEDLDKDLFQRVCKLNESMLEIKETANAVHRDIEALKKEKETFEKKLKLMDGSLVAIKSEINEFRKQKQENLNKVHSIVVVRPSQINMKQSRKEDDQSTRNLIVINKVDLQTSAARPAELSEEKIELKRIYNSLRKDFVQVKNDIRVKTMNLTDLEEKLEKLQLLKFGHKLDLDLVDQIQNQTPENAKQPTIIEVYYVCR